MQSKPNNEMFEKNFDLIFRKKKEVKPVPYKIESPQLAEYELDKSTGEVIKK